jgi:hypothetical protein
MGGGAVAGSVQALQQRASSRQKSNGQQEVGTDWQSWCEGEGAGDGLEVQTRSEQGRVAWRDWAPGSTGNPQPEASSTALWRWRNARCAAYEKGTKA